MIRVLVVDDSPIAQRVLTALINASKEMQVVGVAGNGVEAVQKCRELRPDLVTMDVFMPEMDGIEATKRIMEESPTRIVIVSSMINAKEELRKSFDAVQFGAIEVVAKPHGALSGNYSEVQETLGRVIAEMMEAEPSRRLSWAPSPWEEKRKEPREKATVAEPPPGPETRAERRSDRVPRGYVPRVICIGGSTGAPAVLHHLLASLPAKYPIPIVVAQHIARGFVRGMVDWLDAEVDLRVHLASDGDMLRPGVVVVAPDDRHLRFSQERKGRIELLPGAEQDLCVPSIDVLFASAAAVFGRDCLGILLSGMGRDGAEGLLRVRNAGGVTFGQNEESAIIYGMPREAALRGAVLEELSPPQIVEQLLAVGVNAGSR